MTSAAVARARLIMQFNLLPSLELHPAQVERFMEPALWERLAVRRQAHRHLSRFVLDQEGLAGEWVASFDTGARRLALLPWRLVDRLTLLLGIALNAEWITTRISKREVAAVRGVLSPEQYAFATGRARFLGAPLDWPRPAGDVPLDAWLERSGRVCLDALFEPEPSALARRFRLRQPPETGAAGAAPTLPALEPAKTLRLCQKLAPAVGLECTSLLA